jgi:hypothetical protein
VRRVADHERRLGKADPVSTDTKARGKTQELRTELQQADKKDKGFVKKKIALKKVVANMTMGNDSEDSCWQTFTYPSL